MHMLANLSLLPDLDHLFGSLLPAALQELDLLTGRIVVC